MVFRSLTRRFINDSCFGQRSCVYSTGRQSFLPARSTMSWLEVRTEAVVDGTGVETV